MLDRGSHLFAAVEEVEVMSQEAMFAVLVHNAVVNGWQVSKKDLGVKKDAIIKLKKPKSAGRKEAKITGTREEVAKKFSHIKIAGAEINLITGEKTQNDIFKSRKTQEHK